MKIPCYTLRENTERPITAFQGTNNLVGTDKENILNIFRQKKFTIKDVKKILPEYFIRPITFASFSSNKEIYKKLNLGFKNIQGVDSDSDILPIENN